MKLTANTFEVIGCFLLTFLNSYYIFKMYKVRRKTALFKIYKKQNKITNCIHYS